MISTIHNKVTYVRLECRNFSSEPQGFKKWGDEGGEPEPATETEKIRAG